ncbi:hypothetical protein PENTCL1PPCAC_16605, partial [Pristionchus entomophagus]
ATARSDRCEFRSRAFSDSTTFMRRSTNYPNVVPAFDEFNSFIVYDLDRVTGFWSSGIALTVCIFLLSCDG